MEKGKNQDAYARKHNEDTQLPQILRDAKPAQGGEGREGGFFSPQTSTAGHIQNMTSVANKLGKQRISLKGSSSTQQHQRRDPRGLTNPHILQQQHPHGALEPLCILVNHTPYHHTSMMLEATAATAALLTRHFQPTLVFLFLERWRDKICIYSRFAAFS